MDINTRISDLFETMRESMSNNSIVQDRNSTSGDRVNRNATNNSRGERSSNSASQTVGSTSSISSNRRRSSTAVAERRAVFRPYNETDTPSSNKKRCVPSIFHKEVILLCSKSRNRTLSTNEKILYHNKGLIINIVKLDKKMDETEVFEKLKQNFTIKLMGTDVVALIPIRTTLILPSLDEGEPLRGEVIAKLFHQKPIYLRPLRDIYLHCGILPALPSLGETEDKDVGSSASCSTPPVTVRHSNSDVNHEDINNQSSRIRNASPTEPIITPIPLLNTGTLSLASLEVAAVSSCDDVLPQQSINSQRQNHLPSEATAISNNDVILPQQNTC